METRKNEGSCCKDMSKQRVLATKSRAVHTQGQATGTYSRGKITCSTHPGTSKKERKAGAKSRAVLTQGHVTGTYGRDKITCSTHTGTSKKKRKAGAKSRAVHTQGHIAYRHGQYQVFDRKSSIDLFHIAVNTFEGTNSGHKLDI